MADGLAEKWFAKFMETVRHHDASTALRDAALAAEFDEIECEVYQGTLLDARWFSYSRLS